MGLNILVHFRLRFLHHFGYTVFKYLAIIEGLETISPYGSFAYDKSEEAVRQTARMRFGFREWSIVYCHPLLLTGTFHP